MKKKNCQKENETDHKIKNNLKTTQFWAFKREPKGYQQKNFNLKDFLVVSLFYFLIHFPPLLAQLIRVSSKFSNYLS